jgi:3',5'-cyclic AMP phosphodiesterase CpdA
MISITQISDTHFSLPGNRSHGGFGYDTDAAWNTTFDHAFVDTEPTDLTVITGDLADHGDPDEYQVAVQHLSQVPTPTNILAGNHDRHIAMQSGVPRPGLTMDRVQRVGPWLFVFADTNHNGRTLNADGRLVDHPERLHADGRLGPAECGWISDIIETSDAEHIWLWMHHPPAVGGVFHSSALNDDVSSLIATNPNIRGVGAGHVHSDIVTDIADRPVFVCPALTIGIDMVNWTALPPGYRTYRFHEDGSVDSECHLLDADAWPRFRLPEQAIRRLSGDAQGATG